MATREISDKMASGELTSVKVGGATADDEVVLKGANDTALAAKLSTTPDLIVMTPQVTPPAHAEGNVFYDDVSHTVAIHTDIADITLNLGQEQYMRVINMNGSPILNGEACRHNGVDVTTALPKIALAIADTIENARVLGVATHDIGIGEEGFITTFGQIHDIDTSSYTAGVPMYLSDTVAGSYTNTPPDIVTQVGGVLVVDASVGAAMVSIINHIALPTLFGLLQTAPDTYTLPGAATYEDIDNYSVSDFVGMGVVALTGRITLPNAGWYRMTFTTTVTVDAASPGGDAILFRLYNVTQAIASATTTLTINSSNLTGSRSAAAPFSADAGDVVVMQVGSVDSTADLTFDSVSFDIVSININ